MTGPAAGRRVAALAVAALALLAGCRSNDGVTVGAPPSTSPGIYPVPVPSDDTAVGTVQPDEAAVAAAATYVRTADGVVLPDLEMTPGAAFGDVPAAEICDLHYTQGVRQPRFNAKVLAFSSYGIDIHDRDVYKVDHLIPISLGGTNDAKNLWPQPYDARAGADQKDLIERQLRGLVCSDKLTLPEAQEVIARDWWAAFQTYMGLPINPGSDGPPPPDADEPEPGEIVNGAPCEQEGLIGYTDPKHIRLTCSATSEGRLVWQKRD